AGFVRGAIGKGERPLLGNESLLDGEIVATSAAESRGLPRIDDLAFRLRHKHQSDVGRAIRAEPRLASRDDDTAGHEPGRMRAAAGERPAAAEAVAALHDLRASLRSEGAGDHHARVARVDLADGWLGEAGAAQMARAPVHDVPGDGAVRLGELFENPQASDGVRL